MVDSKIIKDRDSKLTDLAKNMPLVQNYPLIKEVEIKKYLYKSLQNAAGAYINACLIYDGVETEFSDYEEMISKYKEEIFNLPNITPNGVIRPKLETSAEYNLIHSKIVDIVKSYDIDAKIEKMRLPLTIRIVDGVTSDWVENRPRANNIMHSDFWTGGCCDLAFLVPLLGDIERTTVRFAEPVGMKENFLSELPKYEDGEHLYDKYLPYDMKMRKEYLYLQDQVMHLIFHFLENLMLSL